MVSAIEIKSITQELNYLKEKPYQCNYCEVIFPPKALLLHYFKTLIGETPFQVSIYEKSLHEVSIFVGHLLTHKEEKSNKSGKHEVCDESFTPESDETDHTNDTNYMDTENSKPRHTYECSECGEDFSRPKLLIEHAKIHTDLEKPYKCKICSKSFKSLPSIEQHRKIHSGVKKHKCNKCDMAFLRRECFRLHLETHIEKENRERAYKCEVCQKTFTGNNNLKKHKKIHAVDKPHKCTQCDKSFVKRVELTYHLKSHTGERPFICNFCGQGFIIKQNFSRHLDTHNADRKKLYECDLCKKSYFTNTALVSHKKTHTGDKPYKCKHCSMAFVTNANCVRHERTHTGEKPYKCTECNKKFKRPTKCCRGLSTIRETRESTDVVSPQMPLILPEQQNIVEGFLLSEI